MPQLFQVLRCYKCYVFQVHQTKKSNKWECKLCGEKQSIKRHYGLGTAKDCRLHTQKLNGMRGEMDTLKNNLDSDNSKNEENVTQLPQPIQINHKPLSNSKWSNYVEETETIKENSNENMSLGNAQVVLEIPKKQRKLNTNNSRRNTNVQHKKHQENLENYIASPELELNTRDKTVCLVQSNNPEPSIHSVDIIKAESLKKINNKKKFISPALNKNSKWAQFAEEPEESEQLQKSSSPSIGASQDRQLFSLCDDTDLDNVLDI